MVIFSHIEIIFLEQEAKDYTPFSVISRLRLIECSSKSWMYLTISFNPKIMY